MACLERLQMKEEMVTDESQKIYGLRKITVEPVYGNIKQNLGFREFLLRGLEGVKIEFNLVSIAHKLQKIWKMMRENRENCVKKQSCFDFLRNFLVAKFNCGTASPVKYPDDRMEESAAGSRNNKRSLCSEKLKNGKLLSRTKFYQA